ncbi:recombinase family protein [Acinetobacter baumannii]|uniref:recombinase family protein n=1 Tax=Acinetobacter baumannii TaxID=470 RepID=UPI002940364E|nr:recombinase family protein [Acinetobacter baumannii]MDV4331261.1 recombinase family protein [Acinetobacter baumannii]MDV4334896.1 recombinase family protein [Acinetobacter baumannii]
MRIYAYFRVGSGSSIEPSDYLDYLSKNGYQIQLNRLIFEEVSVETSIVYREKIINLVNYSLEEDDILIIKGLDSLGANFIEIEKFVNIINDKKIRLICLDFSKDEIKDNLKKIFFHFIKMGADFENKFSKNSAERNIKTKRVGRPEILNSEQKKEVIKKFKIGHSVYSLAKEYSVTRTVIQRILNKEIERFPDLREGRPNG